MMAIIASRKTLVAVQTLDLLCMMKSGIIQTTEWKEAGYMCDRSEALTILEKVVKGCSEVIPVSDAYLYGSYARGDHDEESDVDIFLTTPLSMPEIEKIRWDISGVASDLSLEHDVVVSVCVRPQAAFQPEHHPYYENIVRDGIKYRRRAV